MNVTTTQKAGAWPAFSRIKMFSPSGALLDETLLDRAIVQLQTMGFSVDEMPQARARLERFAGDEATRLAAIDAACAEENASVLMATRGGYGLSRLLPQLDFPRLAENLNTRQHLLCGHSDITSLQLALMNAGTKPRALLHGPMACFDFGPECGADTQTTAHFLRALSTGSVDVSWAVQPGDAPEQLKQGITGPVWGGNLAMVCSLLGTLWMPKLKGGILVLEDVNEPAYRIERMLLQLLHAGVLDSQQAVVLGNFSEPKPGPHDNGYSLSSAAAFLQKQLKQVPVLMHFPFGHCTPKACWFQGGAGTLSMLDDTTLRLVQTMA